MVQTDEKEKEEGGDGDDRIDQDGEGMSRDAQTAEKKAPAQEEKKEERPGGRLTEKEGRASGDSGPSVVADKLAVLACGGRVASSGSGPLLGLDLAAVGSNRGCAVTT